MDHDEELPGLADAGARPLATPALALVNRAGVDLRDYLTRFDAFLKLIWARGSELLLVNGATPPSVEVWITDDVMRDSDVVRSQLRVSPESRVGIERVGGVVAGKTILSGAADAAIVLLSADVLAAPGTDGELLTLFIAAHELMHVVYGASRCAAGIDTDEIDAMVDPWGAAEMAAVTTAEEYRCDHIALAVLDATLGVTDSDGTMSSFRDHLDGLHLDGLDELLDVLDPGVPDVISRYRVSGEDLGGMWRHTFMTIGEFLVLLAHAQATSTSEEPVLTGSPHPGAAIIAPVWQPLAKHLLVADPLPSPDAWVNDHQALRDIGRTGLVEVWRRLGLHPRPERETFYLGVVDPGQDG